MMDNMDIPQKTIAVSGASGLVGSHLCAQLRAQGHTIVAISRSFFASPAPSLLDGCDAVIHLAGAGISDHRWNRSYKDLIRSSRVQSTVAVSRAMAKCVQKPRVFVCASAVGIYGDRGDEVLTEDSGTGVGFLPDVARAWEAACEPARDAGVRVVNMRFGVILAREGGVLSKMLPPFKWGLGGPMGSGKQWMSWVAIQDVVGAIQFAISHEELHGPVNVVAPNSMCNADFAKALGHALHRPACIPVPAVVLRLAMGEMADALLLSSQRVVPSVLKKSGFNFQFPEIEAALKACL